MKNKVNEFKSWLKANDIKANYYCYIKKFILDTQVSTPEQVTEKLINDYIIKISEQLTKGGVNNYIKAIKKFAEFPLGKS